MQHCYELECTLLERRKAEDNGFRFKVTESERHGVVVKIAEVDK